MGNDYEVLNENGLEGFDLRRSKAREASVASATALWADLRAGKVPSYLLQEALAPRTPAIVRAIDANYPGIFRLSETMTTSDFPYLTGDVLDRMLLARYREFPAAWRSYVKVTTLRDFHSVERYAVDGLEGQWEAVAENAEMKYGALTEAAYTYAPKKYAKAAKLSFEALMNDDLSAFDSIPDRLGRGGARTVAKFVSDLYLDANGPDATLVSAANGNMVTGNPVLSLVNLNTAWGMLRGMVDADGEPIMIESVILVVPPALEVTARNIVNATTVRTTLAGGTNNEIEVQNWLGASLTVVVDPYIPLICTANPNTPWLLFADPNIGRPAIEVGFVRGFAEPQLYQKLANTARVGGGVDQAAGDFGTMSQEFKGVLAFGGATISPKSVVGSQGDAS